MSFQTKNIFTNINDQLDKKEQKLSGFKPISLQEMDNVRLQDRVDTKFMLREDLFLTVLEEMHRDYYVLEINGARTSSYETLYFDTDQFRLYLMHHNGKLNRYKVRSRRYVESNLHFFEVKFKNSKGRTIKDRIKRPELVTEIVSNSNEAEFLIQNSGIDPTQLMPRLWVNYHRITFVNKHANERLTIDMNLSFTSGDQKFLYNGLVIAEVKQSSLREKSPFITLMRKYRVKERSISKYCLGVISLNNDIKKNNFKPILLYIQKLLKAS